MAGELCSRFRAFSYSSLGCVSPGFSNVHVCVCLLGGREAHHVEVHRNDRDVAWSGLRRGYACMYATRPDMCVCVCVFGMRLVSYHPAAIDQQAADRKE